MSRAFLKEELPLYEKMSEYEQKLYHIWRNRNLFDFHTLVPFDMYMYYLQAELWPALRLHTAPRYTILNMPPWQMNVWPSNPRWGNLTYTSDDLMDQAYERTAAHRRKYPKRVDDDQQNWLTT